MKSSILKYQILCFILLLAEILSAKIDIYLYCNGICSGRTQSNQEISLIKRDPPFEPYPPVYTASLITSEQKLYFKVEDIFYVGISGHIIVDGYSFYIGKSDYFKIINSAKEVEFFEKNEPKIMQYAYINAGISCSPIEVEFTVPIGKQLYEAQFPSFSDNCLSKIYYTKSQIEIDFSQLFNSIIEDKTITFPSDFSGTINGNSSISSPISITSNNYKLLISLGNEDYINITITGSILKATCSGNIIISSLEEGCESYNELTKKCEKCFDDYTLDWKGICQFDKEGYYYAKGNYHKCYETCKTCKLGGNKETHNCVKCKSMHIKFQPDYRNYGFCFENCSSVGLIEYFDSTLLDHCVIACKLFWGMVSYENKYCLMAEQTLGLGLYIIREIDLGVKECPEDYPFYRVRNDYLIYCVKQCNNLEFVQIHNNKKYCHSKCPENENYLRDGNVCGSKNESSTYYYLAFFNIYTTNCKDLNKDSLNYQKDNDEKICDFMKDTIYEYYDGTKRIYVDSCFGDYQYKNTKTKKCCFIDNNCDKNQFIKQNSPQTCVEQCDENYYDYYTRECKSNPTITRNLQSYYLIEESPNNYGIINNACPIDYPFLLDGKYCVDNCGDFYISSDNECTKNCPSYIDLDTKRCVHEIGKKFEIEGTRKILEDCTTISLFLYKDESNNNNGICVKICPEDAPFVDKYLSKCIKECPQPTPFYYPWIEEEGTQRIGCTFHCLETDRAIYKKGCVEFNQREKIEINWDFDQFLFDCSDNCFEYSNYFIARIPTDYVYLDEVDNIKQLYNEFTQAFNAFIEDAFYYPFTRQEIIFQDFTLQRYPINDSFDLKDYNTALSFEECKEILKLSYNIDNIDDLLVFKGDRYRKDLGIDQVEYVIYDRNGNKLDLSLCEGVNVTIKYTLNESSGIDLDLFTSMITNFDIDILNTSSPFYHDICFPFTDENGRDVVLKDRRRYYYPNVSLCDNGCEYEGIEVDTLTVICNCNIKTEVKAEIFPPADPKYFGELYENTNLWLFKCYKVFISFKKWNINCGLYLVGGLVLISILLIPLFVCTFTERKGIMSSKMLKKPAAPIKPSDDSTRMEFNISASPINLRQIKKQKEVYEMMLLHLETYDEMPFEKAKTNDNREIGKVFFDTFSEKIDTIQLICFSKEFDFIYLSISSYIFSILFELTINAFLFNDDVISENYHNNGEMSTFTRIFLSTMSNIITALVMLFIIQFIRYEKAMNLFSKEILPETPKIQAIKRYFNCLKCQFTVYFFITIIISATCFYFIVIFCTVYPNSQYNWLKDWVTGLIIDLLKYCVWSLVVSLLRVISLRYGFESIYYMSLYLNNISLIISL